MLKTLISVVCCACLIFFNAPTAIAQCDCDFVIPLSAYQVNGSTLKGVNGQVGVKPGDKVCLASGTRGDLTMTNMKGNAANPILVTNMCDGTALFRGLTAGTGRLLYVGNCSFIRVSGTGNPGVQYGIEMTVGVQAIDFRDLSTNVEADHIYIHDIGYSALNAKTDPTCDPKTWRGAFTMRDVLFHDNKISNIGGEGVYIGESHYNTTVPVVCSGITLQALEHEVIGAKVYNNIFQNIGRDGIQMGSVTSGGEIHHNTITNFGATGEYAQQSGIQINPGTNAEVYNNIIDTGTGFGLFAGGRGGSHIYNNIIANCAQGGIICADYAPLDPSGFIFSNNTLVNNKVYGIYMLSENTQQNQFVNNIIVGPNDANYLFIKLNNPNKIKWTETNNIQTKDISTIKFVNPSGRDYRLQTTSSCKDGGKDMRGYGVTKDLDDLPRPQGVTTDIGAYEVNAGGPTTSPTVNAGADKTITLPTNSTALAGSASGGSGTMSSYTWSKIAGGTATMTNSNTATLSVSNMDAGSYTFRLTVKDSKGATASDDATVIVNAPSTTALAANAGPDKTINLPFDAFSLTGTATGNVKYWEWTKVSGGIATLIDIGKPILLLSALIPGSYVFRLKVTDDKGAVATDEVAVTVKLLGINQPPVANAGADKTITLPTSSTTLTGSATDADGTVASYTWSKVSGGAATLTNTNTATLGLSGLVAGTYTFRLAVKDNSGAVGSDDVVVIVKPASTSNTPPVANAGADKTITLPTNSTTLAGSGTDANGTVAYYAWTKVSGGAATLANAGAATLSLSGLVAGAYTFRLTVTDNGGATASDDVVLTVNPAPSNGGSAAPVANAGADKTITLPTNTLALAGSATNGNGTVKYWEWTKISGGAATLTDAGKPTLQLSGLVAGTYVFRLRVTDNLGAVGNDEVTVTVNPAEASKPNVAPVVNAGADKTITLPTNSTTLAGSATDADGTVKYWEWIKVSGGVVTLTDVGKPTLQLSGFVAGTYVFRLRVTDNSGYTGSDDVTVTVNASTAPKPNVAPVANAGSDKTITLPTNTLALAGNATDADGTVKYWEWTKASGGAATLTDAGQPTLQLSGLVAGTYVFRLRVTDNLGAVGSDEVTVTVNASTAPKPNVAPVANAGADVTVTLPATTVTLYGSGTDSDGTVKFWEWTKVSGGTATLTNAGTATLGLSSLAAGTYTFRLKITDNSGATATDDMVVTVKAASTGNAKPVANAGADKSITLPTNTLAIAGSGTDADGTVLYWEWTKVSGGAVTMADVGKSTLQLSGLVAGTYTFRLRVTDNLGAIGGDEVTITVKAAGTTTARMATNNDYGSLAEPVDTANADNTAFAATEESFSFMDKQFTGGHDYAIRIFDPNGNRLYAGAWSQDRYDSVFPTSGFYVYHIIQDGVKIDTGKVYISR